MGKYSGIKWKNRIEQYGRVIQKGAPIPQGIVNYYIEHGYADKGIPLNADTCREIAELV